MIGSKIPKERRLKIIIRGIIVEMLIFFEIKNHFSPTISILVNNIYECPFKPILLSILNRN
jgi:hypothetical protein